MRAIPPDLQHRLNSGVTTLCRCWVLTRGDGTVQGFTDHDRDVPLGSITCRADTALSGSEMSVRLGFAIEGAEVFGALSDESLNESDLAAGRYDAAQVDTYIVDWNEPSLHILLSRATLGEVRREGRAFTAELRGLADRLAQESGRLYTAACSADLGDARCTVDLDNPLYRGKGTVETLTGLSAFAVSGLHAFAQGWFDAGKLVWTSGVNSGLASEIKRHRIEGNFVLVELWQAAAELPEPGDGFSVTAGCDKRFETCRDRFANAINFRGFPHIPGNDFVMRYAVEGEPGHDGKSMQGG